MNVINVITSTNKKELVYEYFKVLFHFSFNLITTVIGRKIMNFQVKYKGKSVNLKNFLQNHPGGLNTLSGYKDMEIENIFNKYEHSKSAEYLLNQSYMTEKDNIKANNDLEVREIEFFYDSNVNF
jgi:hypothetical protein